MKLKKRILGLIAVALLTTSAWAQMKFTFEGGATAKEVEMPDGSMLVQLPAGTDLNSAITGVKVNGTAVDATSVVPNPTETFITDGEIETFVYEGKAYSFRFLAGEYFTAVMFSDPHVAEGSGISVADMQTMATKIINMNKEGGPQVTFATAPKGFVPTTDLVICLGDMDKDSQSDKSVFNGAMQGFNDAKIPFITIAGNHDFVPDYWTGEDGGNGLTASFLSTGGKECNDIALELIQSQYKKAEGFGNFEVEIIKDASLSGAIHPGHFTFKYKGVRFYCANNYWFQKPYTWSWGSATYHPADGTINALNSYVEQHASEASVWVSHYPFYSEANADNDASARWWLDQTDVARTIKPSNAASSPYYNGDEDIPSYKTDEGRALAEKKKRALADIIVKTKNPRHFSGHSHKDDGRDVTATNGKVFRDHTIENTVAQRRALVVLCKEGEGVIDVQRVNF